MNVKEQSRGHQVASRPIKSRLGWKFAFQCPTPKEFAISKKHILSIAQHPFSVFTNSYFPQFSRFSDFCLCIQAKGSFASQAVAVLINLHEIVIYGDFSLLIELEKKSYIERNVQRPYKLEKFKILLSKKQSRNM